MIPSFVPQIPNESRKYCRHLDLNEITERAFHRPNDLVASEEHGKIIATSLTYRGSISVQEIRHSTAWVTQPIGTQL